MSPPARDLYGPNSHRVEALLGWLASGGLLRPSGPAGEGVVEIDDFRRAVAMARRGYGDASGAGSFVDWGELRQWESAELYEPGTLDLPEWAPHKLALRELKFEIDEAARPTLDEAYLAAYDDILSDLSEIALGLAVNGRLSPLHERMHLAYLAGGWPCGLSGPMPSPRGPFDPRDRLLYVFRPPPAPGDAGESARQRRPANGRGPGMPPS